MTQTAIWLTEHDYRRLRNLVPMRQPRTGGLDTGVDMLEELLDIAQIVRPDRVPRNVATMNSTVRYEDVAARDQRTVTIVYPDAADPAQGRISVLSPVGMALIGLAKGQEADLPLPHGQTRRIRIEEVLDQPEALGEPTL
jgi:regulator of nucleoside diphosphate kinase